MMYQHMCIHPIFAMKHISQVIHPDEATNQANKEDVFITRQCIHYHVHFSIMKIVMITWEG